MKLAANLCHVVRIYVTRGVQLWKTHTVRWITVEEGVFEKTEQQVLHS